MSRLSDLAGVLKGARKVAKALGKQGEKTASDAWLQSSIREGVERAMANKLSPEELGKKFVENIPVPVMELRHRIEEMSDQVRDTGQSSTDLRDAISSASSDIQSILKHFTGGSEALDIAESVSTNLAGLVGDDIVDDAQQETSTSPDSLTSIFSAVTNYQDIVNNLDRETQNLNDTISKIKQQIADIQLASSAGLDLDIQGDIDKMGVGVTGDTPEPVSVDETPAGSDITEVIKLISKLKLDLTTLQDDTAVLQSSAAGIADHVSEIVSHLSNGDISSASKLAQQPLTDISSASKLAQQPLTELGDISSASKLAQQPLTELGDMDAAINATSLGSYPSDSVSATEPDSDSTTEPVTMGNYTDPFSSNPPSRGYSTNPPSRRYSTIACRRTHVGILPQKATLYQMYIRRIGLSAAKLNKKDDKILSGGAESFVKAGAANKESLASYTATKKSSGKRRSLDGRAKRRAIPDTQMKRALAFGGLAASLGWGTVSEMMKRSMNHPTNESNKPALLSDENIERIVSKLCEMRGAALKIGQMVSIQDEGLISPEFAKIMTRVRENADFMPDKQFEEQMANNLGPSWREKFKKFDNVPFAAASLGQVHYATLHDGLEVVVKVQYPGVADSINSDIDNLTMILNYVDLVPKGVHIDKALMIAKKELAYETDYIREARSQEKMRELLRGDNDFVVPRTIPELCTKHLLTQEFVSGDPIDSFVDAPIELRNSISLKMLKLCLRELFEFQYMQTDPNWSNFFYDTETSKIKLLDFGATLELSQEFSNNYLQVIRSCATGDRQTIIDASIKMEFLSGYESEIMLDAHCEAIKVVGEPFATDAPYDFVEQAAYKRVARLLEVFGKHRITAPPEESYALNRKLSGAFLLCNKLNAVIPCKPLFDAIYEHKMDEKVTDNI